MATTLSKSDLVKLVAAEAGVTREQAQAVLFNLGTIVRANTSEGITVSVPGLGRFTEKVRAARTGRNPATGQSIEIAESRTLAFKAAKATPAS